MQFSFAVFPLVIFTGDRRKMGEFRAVPSRDPADGAHASARLVDLDSWAGVTQKCPASEGTPSDSCNAGAPPTLQTEDGPRSGGSMTMRRHVLVALTVLSLAG